MYESLRSSGPKGPCSSTSESSAEKVCFSEEKNEGGATEINTLIQGGNHEGAEFNVNAGNVTKYEEDEDHSSEDEEKMDDNDDYEDAEEYQQGNPIHEQGATSNSRNKNIDIINTTIQETTLTDTLVNANAGDVDYTRSENEPSDDTSCQKRRCAKVTTKISGVKSKRTVFNANAGNVIIKRKSKRKKTSMN